MSGISFIDIRQIRNTSHFSPPDNPLKMKLRTLQICQYWLLFYKNMTDMKKFELSGLKRLNCLETTINIKSWHVILVQSLDLILPLEMILARYFQLLSEVWFPRKKNYTLSNWCCLCLCNLISCNKFIALEILNVESYINNFYHILICVESGSWTGGVNYLLFQLNQ